MSEADIRWKRRFENHTKAVRQMNRFTPAERVVLHGSRAKGCHKNGSDIDLTLEGEGLGFDELLKIMSELDDLLLPCTIDLSLWHMIDHAGLREHIQRVGQECCRRREAGQRPSPAGMNAAA